MRGISMEKILFFDRLVNDLERMRDKLLALNETAAWLWQQAKAQGDFTIGSLADALCEEYDVTADEAKADVASIIAEWQNVGVIE